MTKRPFAEDQHQHEITLIVMHLQTVLGLQRSRLTLFRGSYKIIKDNNIEAVKLDHCDQKLQWFYTAAILDIPAFVICIASDVNNCELLRLRTNNH